MLLRLAVTRLSVNIERNTKNGDGVFFHINLKKDVFFLFFSRARVDMSRRSGLIFFFFTKNNNNTLVEVRTSPSNNISLKHYNDSKKLTVGDKTGKFVNHNNIRQQYTSHYCGREE